MPISMAPQMFIPAYISRVPETAGVYALNDGFEIIYYGSAEDSIRDRLMDHYNGKHGTCTQRAIWFLYETTTSLLERVGELLAEFNSDHGKLPECNDQTPPALEDDDT